MEGRSAYGNRNKKLYYYYCCTNTSCRFKLPETEIEGVIREAMKAVASEETILNKIVEKTNIRLKQELPRLSGQRQRLQKEILSLTDKAGCIMEKYIGVKDGEEFVKESLAKLSIKKRQLQNQIDASDIVIKDIERESVDRDFVSQILGSFEEMYRDDVKPYQRKELLFKSLAAIELSDNLLKVGVPLEKFNGMPIGRDRTDINHDIASGSLKKMTPSFLRRGFVFSSLLA
jgi:SHS2 domain-containing protein